MEWRNNNELPIRVRPRERQVLPEGGPEDNDEAPECDNHHYVRSLL